GRVHLFHGWNHTLCPRLAGRVCVARARSGQRPAIVPCARIQLEAAYRAWRGSTDDLVRRLMDSKGRRWLMSAIGRVAGVLVLLTGGLANAAPPKRAPPAKKHVKAEEPAGPRGVVFVVGGVGGFDVLANAAQWALPRAGVPHEVREFVWTHGWGQLFK